ncbi:hypothetical protein C2G38_2297511 [Gigaspora rosea]|uniref:Uncharacterized protein n=1 Tax=Gigaspora rosea TaxID=44941 RepID=A0A397W4I1_9GLOM|nr:hypothetical protein C2G38_2297511 [Gigaspora rosea]
MAVLNTFTLSMEKKTFEGMNDQELELRMIKGIAQNPDLTSNPEDWSNKNFLTLKSILKNCLPLIRYFQMSGDDIYDHIQPYKKIIEKALWKDLVKRHMTSNRPISSVVLPPRMILTQELPHKSTELFSNVINENMQQKLHHRFSDGGRSRWNILTWLLFEWNWIYK